MHDARSYARRGHRKVDGWLHPTSALVIHEIGRWQVAGGIRGAVGEIGVHHGRLFILLDLLRAAGERSFAIDVFGDQELNVDGSGRGDEAIFRGNVRRHTGSDTHLAVIRRSSAEVEPEEIIEAVGPVRLLSVDGGHTAELAHNDLRLADATLATGGVVVLDDVFNESWPGVVSGLHDYLASEDADMVPVAIIPNKVLLARRERAQTYRSMVASLRQHGRVATDELFGHDVVRVQPFEATLAGWVTKQYRRTEGVAVVGALARVLRRLLGL